MASRVVLAPLAFKGSLTAADAARAMARGAARAAPSAEVVVLPMADGGDGSIDAVRHAGFTRVPVPAHGPTGHAVEAALALRGGTALVELASTCGMSRLPGGVLAPMTASTAGLGEVMRAALDHGARELIVCLGGSASTDGGAGLLVALGARLVDRMGRVVTPMGATLEDVADLDLTGLDPRLGDATVTIAVDVTAPLLGPHGAAPVFAPQKGASPAEVDRLEAGLTAWSEALHRATGRSVATVPGAGAAGGTAAALLAVLDAALQPGAELIAAEIGLAPAIRDADVVVTGEGRLDLQTSMGKGAAWVARLAASGRTQAIAVCGRIDVPDDGMRELGFTAWADCRTRARTDEESVRQASSLVESATRDLLLDVLGGGPH